MNRNITAGWGVRRNGLNLNASAASVAAALAATTSAAAAAPSAAAETPQQGTATTPDANSAPTSPRPLDASSNTPQAGAAEAGPSRSSRATSPSSGLASKRKLRASKEAGSSKRSRNTTATGDATADKYAPPATRLRDLGGVGPAIEKVLELIAMPLCHPEIYAHTGVKPPRGVLLHGPPGCGKTMLAGAIAGVSRLLLS